MDIWFWNSFVDILPPESKTKTFLPLKVDLDDMRQANAMAPDGSNMKLNSW